MTAVVALLLRAARAGPQPWAKNDLYDAVFYIRVTLATVLGILLGLLGSEGWVTFFTFFAFNMFAGSTWLKYQCVDIDEYEDPERISHSPLAMEGLGPALSLFMLLWITSYSIAH